jgi:hypothetical protein
MLAHGANTRQDTSERGWLIAVLFPKGEVPAKDVHRDGASGHLGNHAANDDEDENAHSISALWSNSITV